MSKWIFVICCLVSCSAYSVPESAAVGFQESDSEETTARRHADRFLDLLKRRPSFGTALERISSFHIERGSLDELISQLRDVPSDQPDFAVQWLIAGMLEIQRGHGADVVASLESVEQKRPDDPVASQALGLAFRDSGNISAAAKAFERAVQKKPTRPDLRSIYHELARLHSRSGDPQRALEVWQQLEAAFPGDRAIQEDVAARLQEDGQLRPALDRWQKLATDASSPDQRTQYHLSVADIQLRLGQNKNALKTLESELGQIRPGSWLDDIIRTKVESALLSSQGRQGVIQYYQDRLQNHPDDIASISRLAALLANQGQFAKAAIQYQQAIDKMPSSVELRTSLITLLASQGDLEKAIAVGRELIELRDAGTDEYELVGRLILRNPQLQQAERKQQASDVWMRICGNESDAGTLGYTARLHRESGLPNRAIKLFRSLVQVAPENAAWREELGETLYELGNREAALQEWQLIADGPRRNTQSLTQLSEILEKFSESVAALKAMQQACELEPAISDNIRLARLLRQSGQLDAGYEQLDTAAELASSLPDQRMVNEARIDAWKQDPSLYQRTAQLRQRLKQDEGNAAGWLQLALMYQADQRFADAVPFVELATKADAQSVLGWQAAADIYFQAGLLDRAATANRQLAEVSPQLRMTALQQVVRLEQQLGRSDKAIEAAEQLVDESPGHTDICRQFADLCFESGRETDGLECLQQCLRQNPEDYQLSIDLADILAAQFQTEQAASLLWRTFRKVDDFSHRLSLLDPLVKLAQQSESVDRVIDRLAAASSLDPVDRSLCVATALRLAGEPTKAHEHLNQASQQFGRDIRILKMLVTLAEADDNLALAEQYQRQVTAISATAVDQIRLATLKFQTGQLSETELSWIRDARSGNDTLAAIRSIDRFLDGGRIEAAELMSERLARDRPTDWRVLYRLAMIQWRLDHKDAAVSTFQKIIALKLPAAHVFVESGSELPGPSQRVRTAVASPAGSVMPSPPLVSPLARRVNQIVTSLNWLQLYTGDELWSQNLTAPTDYGAARCAALGFVWISMTDAEREQMLTSIVGDNEQNSNHLVDWAAIVVTSRWADATADARFDELTTELHLATDTEFQLVLAGLLSHGGVFRSPATQPRSDTKAEAASMLLTAAESVATERPEWLTDIGGWLAVRTQLLRLDRSEDCADVLARLTESTNPATLISATDLAFVSQDMNRFAQCLQKTLPLASQNAAVRTSLDSQVPQLRWLANRVVAKDDWKLLQRTVDLFLELRAILYLPIGSDNAPEARLYRFDDRYLETANAGSSLNVRMTGSANTGPGLQDNQRMGHLHPRRRRALTAKLPLVFTTHMDAAEHVTPQLAVLLHYLSQPNAHRERKEQVLTYLNTVANDQSKPIWVPAAFALAHHEAVAKRYDNAIRRLVPVVEHLPEDVNLHMLTAKYLQDAGAHVEALELLNRLPVQHERVAILKTERLTLTLCVASNNSDRAQLAAARLFDLELAADDVAFIAERLDALHLTELSERFTARVTRTTSGRAEQLQKLMQHYFDSGNRSAAVRIARQFLLQPSITLEGTSALVSVELRKNALRVLAESDAIEPMILQLQWKLREDDASFHQHHLLVELLKADGQNAEADKIAKPLRISLVDDPKAGIQLARQLERQGRLESACDVCRYLLEADSGLFHRDYYRFIRLFERNGRLHELATLVLATDLLEQSNGHWGVQQLTERLLPDSEELGLRLFAAAWHAWPASRSALLANVSHDAIWSLPEVFVYGRTALLPTAGKTVEPWHGIADQVQVRGQGIATGTLTRMLQVPVATERAEEFLDGVRSALQMQPTWNGGQIYAALLEAHRGRTDTAVQQFTNLLQQQLADMPPMVVWVTACELHKIDTPALNQIAVQLLEHLHAIQQSGVVLLKSGASWHTSPDYLLVQISAEYHDVESMRAIMGRLTSQISESQNTDGNDAMLSKLTACIEHHLPEEAQYLRDLEQAGQSKSSTSKQAETAVHTEETNEIIKVIRERLLRQQP
jgi:tetratricopeptide (TPR) repeat protein